MAAYRIRPAVTADAPILAWHRAAMFRDMGLVAAHELEPLIASSRTALAAALASGEYLGWVVECDGAVVAGGGLLVRLLLPGPDHPAGGREAYVLNVYAEPAHRRRGLARMVMERILAWSAEAGIARISLHASDEGRPLYEQLGFAATNEMRRAVVVRE